MGLVEYGQHAVAGGPVGGVGGHDGTAHVGAGYDGGAGTVGGVVVVVEAHDDFCVAVVDGDGGDLDEDFIGTRGRQRGRWWQG